VSLANDFIHDRIDNGRIFLHQGQARFSGRLLGTGCNNDDLGVGIILLFPNPDLNRWIVRQAMRQVSAWPSAKSWLESIRSILLPGPFEPGHRQMSSQLRLRQQPQPYEIFQFDSIFYPALEASIAPKTFRHYLQLFIYFLVKNVTHIRPGAQSRSGEHVSSISKTGIMANTFISFRCACPTRTWHPGQSPENSRKSSAPRSFNIGANMSLPINCRQLPGINFTACGWFCIGGVPVSKRNS